MDGDLVSQDLWFEEWLAAPIALRLWRCRALYLRSSCLALCTSSVETLRHRTCGLKKIERRLAAPAAHILERMLWIASAFYLSGLAYFLSGDLAPEDLWNSKKNQEGCSIVSKPILLVLISFKKIQNRNDFHCTPICFVHPLLVAFCFVHPFS
jgi:hypothetical protein